MLLAVKVTSAFDRLTRPERVNVLILDTGIHASSCFFLPPVLRFLYTSSSARSCSFSRSSCAIRGGETGKWHIPVLKFSSNRFVCCLIFSCRFSHHTKFFTVNPISFCICTKISDCCLDITQLHRMRSLVGCPVLYAGNNKPFLCQCAQICQMRCFVHVPPQIHTIHGYVFPFPIFKRFKEFHVSLC